MGSIVCLAGQLDLADPEYFVVGDEGEDASMPPPLRM